MKKTIYTSILTFFVTSAIIASTGLSNLATTDDGRRIQLYNNRTFTYIENDKLSVNPYIGNYYIGEVTIENYIETYLNKKGITKDNDDYEFSYKIMKQLFTRDQNRIKTVIGNFTYTITKDKLIISEDDGKQIFNWDYEVKNNILYATVYGSDKMAIGKFIQDGKYLEVTSPELNDHTKVLLQKNTN